MPKKNEMSKQELDALKEELKKELLIEMKKDEAEKYKKEQEALKKASEKTEFKIPTNNKIDKFDRNIAKNKKESQVENIAASSNLFLIAILILVVGGVYFIPTIQKMVSKSKNEPTIKQDSKKEVTKDSKEKFTWESGLVKNIKFPIMRNDINSTDSYYLNDSADITTFSNNDILYNAFIDEYSGNIGTYVGGYNGTFCGQENQHKEINAKYIDARIYNLFTKNAQFTHSDFYVPLSSGSEYYGLWRFNPNTYSYVYYGECNPQGIIGDIYYDVLVQNDIKTSDDYKTAYLTYNIGFAKILDNTYEIYKNPDYTDLLISDTLKTDDYKKELNDVFAEFIKNHKTKKYKYTYTTKNCSYSELCYLSGEYITE